MTFEWAGHKGKVLIKYIHGRNNQIDLEDSDNFDSESTESEDEEELEIEEQHLEQQAYLMFNHQNDWTTERKKKNLMIVLKSFWKMNGLQFSINENMNMLTLELYHYQLSKVLEAFTMFRYTRKAFKFEIRNILGMIVNN